MSGRGVILYSQSDHFDKAVEAMRAMHPDATLTVLIPAGREDLTPDGAEAIELPDSGGALARGRAIIRQLRALDADVLCVLYPSPNLRVLAALSGAQTRYWCGEDGKLRPLDERLPGVLANLAWQRFRGEVRYAWRWLVVRLTRASG